jgi:probable rRNA maturation factor
MRMRRVSLDTRRQPVRVARRCRDNPAAPGGSDVSIDISNESGIDADNAALVRLASFALDQLRIHPLVELSILLVDEDTMSAYHEKYLGEPGPTDVLSFPMDELRPPADGEEPPAGLLGDIVLCPAVTERQAQEHQRTPNEEAEYLLVHGLLHLLGYDHATPEDHAEMFGLTDKIVSAWAQQRTDRLRGSR